MATRRTFSDYKAAVVHALGGEPASGVDKGFVVNDALQHLCALHQWRWRRGGPVCLDIVADQNYVELPSDFGEEYATTYPQSFARQMIRTTVEEIQLLRSNPYETFGYTYWYAINSGSLDEDSREEGLTVNVMELYPTPGSNVSDAITLTYLRNVDLLADDADVPQIPIWMDYAFDLLCRSFAMTLEDDNPQNSAQARFDAMLPDLIKRDGQTQHRLGVMRGGLWPRTTGIDPLYPDVIGDPAT